MLEKIRTGDIDFMISSTANAATVAPESGICRSTISSARRTS